MAWLEKRSGTYWVFWRDGAGKKRKERAYTDKRLSEEKRLKVEKAQELGEAGWVDPLKDQNKRPLSEHVADWLADLRSTGRDSHYVYTLDRRMKKLREDCGWQ